MTMKGGTKNVGWSLRGVRVDGISEYNVVNVGATAADARERKPLKVVSEWTTKRWRVEVNATYSLALLTDAVYVTLLARIKLEIPDVRMKFSAFVWGEEQPDPAIVRFFTEDKLFNLEFKPDDMKIGVDIASLPSIASILIPAPALNELVELHVRYRALPVMWPAIKQEVGKVFQDITNGEVIRVIIRFLLLRRGNSPPATPKPAVSTPAAAAAKTKPSRISESITGQPDKKGTA
ncbi:uncharacterized protein LOC119104650 isoform X1 [Pollicipes pollicipes]|uniref:uncharacterized protein LOC119104650 isoform X1 n=1 Tax=Pollicipes pollicipes TaxID=41117 RepID=UPI001885A3C0|nr:uncharacterized protein LOC119104650 isoform X1 [Pollicipes pollicipes]